MRRCIESIRSASQRGHFLVQWEGLSDSKIPPTNRSPGALWHVRACRIRRAQVDDVENIYINRPKILENGRFWAPRKLHATSCEEKRLKTKFLLPFMSRTHVLMNDHIHHMQYENEHAMQTEMMWLVPKICQFRALSVCFFLRRLAFIECNVS